MIDLRLGDCLKIMEEVENKSVNMILCDLPYGTTDKRETNGIRPSI